MGKASLLADIRTRHLSEAGVLTTTPQCTVWLMVNDR